jgi:N-acetylmuramoyl-L-alanine amidase
MRHISLVLLLFACASCGRNNRHHPMHGHYPIRPGVLITLDAGHGGDDPGALSQDKKYEEKELALTTTLLVRNHLRTMGYQVQLTRDSDTFITLDDRSALANATGSTLFVSIHYNASTNRAAEGVEVYTWLAPEKGQREVQSKELAEAIHGRVLRYTQAPDRGIKQANYSVLRKTEMPAALIEGGFVTNNTELERLKDPKYLNCIAWGIAQGIDDYYTNHVPVAQQDRAAAS